jgi:acyl-CoA reductase-like NAD-dependent aldehyde dehydrogenase
MTIPHFPLLLAGNTNTDLTIPVISPFDQTPIASVDCAKKEHIEEALSIAYDCYQHRETWLPMPQRIEILEKIAIEMTAQQEMLAIEASREGGKPLLDSRIEVGRAIDGIKLCIETLRTDAGRVIPMNYNAASANRIAFTQREPLGVVVAVSAFNHPVNLIIHQIGSALAAGCPVIIKPATDTPLSCLRLVNIFHHAGLPKAWCQAMVIDDNALATSLVVDERVGFFSFIGSAKVGWSLRSQLAAGTRCSLEHGGVAPVIIDQQVNLDKIIPSLAKGGFYHAGQVCVSVQRIYVHEAIALDFAKHLAKEASQLKVGDPVLPETQVGPLIRPAELERIDTWVHEAVEMGALLLCGGKPTLTTCYEPTVLFNPPINAKVSQREVFGPVVCVYAYRDWQEAIDAANALPFAFQSAIFTDNLTHMMQAYENLSASAVMVNDHTAFRVDGMPFAGLKHSGLGVGGIPYSIHDMQVEKMLVIRTNY